MKQTVKSLFGAAMLLAAVSLQTHAQGLVYDQQSATNPAPFQGRDGYDVQADQLTQSFIPTLSAIGFVQFQFFDMANNGNNGATVYVNLWEGSPNINSATLLSSTTPIYMPNGFGETTAGVSTFDFSSNISLTPGQTYYLQPVVFSGDNPWPIVVLNYDTYSNGQLFSEGNAIQPSMDMWFREGVVTVPEPSVLVLLGISGLLVFGFKRRSKLPVLCLIGLLFTVQVRSVQAAPDSVVQATAGAAGLTSVSPTDLPRSGTFWVMTTGPNGQLMALPYPVFPTSLAGSPAYSVMDNVFIVDGTGGQLMSTSNGRMSREQAASTTQEQAQTMADLISQIEFPTNSSGTNGYYPPYDYQPILFDTNGLWLEASNETPNLGLRLHNPTGDNYQLLATSNLLNTNWDLGQILYGASGDYADFTPVPMTNAAAFYRVHHANPVMYIYNSQYAIEPNPTNSDVGQVGTFYIQDEGSATNDVPVYYRIGGTAQNGVDYSNLTGEVTISNDQGYAEIDIDPIADGLKPDQTVILTLTENTNYLIDPAYYSATNILYANPEVYPTGFGDFPSICPDSSGVIVLGAQDPRGLPLTYTILTYPTHGDLTGTPPYMTYTPTNCYEGQDSFTFKVNDGFFDSAPATVTLSIANTLYAYPVTAQTCRGASVGFYLNCGDYGCGEATNYLISAPSEGTVSNLSGQNFIYTPNGTNFTGTDTFNYIVYDACGDTATNTVAITVGDASIQINSQSIVTPTNQPVPVTLNAVDYEACNADTNYYTYTLTGSLTNGYLSGTPPNLTYTPTNGEGADAFQFTVSDGVWTSAPASVNLYAVAGPVLAAESIPCYPYGPAVQLDWTLDTNVQQMVQSDGLYIQDFVVYRATNSGGPYTPITTISSGQMNYQDDTAVVGQVNYYVVNFESPNAATSTNYESPLSNEIGILGQNPADLIPPNAVWQVVTDATHPSIVTNLQAPFSSYGTNQYPNLNPLPNTLWPVGATWSNHITLFIPSNSVPLAQVTYAIAIDNSYQLYLNNSNAPIESVDHSGFAVWSSFKAFQDVAPGLLHYGTNNIGVVIEDDGDINYFSMIVTTNNCGY